MTAEGAHGSTRGPWAVSGDVCPGGIRTSLDRGWGPRLSPYRWFPCRDLIRLAQLWLSLGQGSGQGPPLPTPGCSQRGWLSWSSPAGAVTQGSGGALCPGHQGKGGFSGASSLCSCDVPSPHKEAGVWQQGWGPRPESRPSHSHVQGLARTREPPVPPPERPSHRPALSPSCTWASCPCRGVQAAEGRVRGRSPHLRGPGAPLLGSAQMEVAPGGR